MKKLLIVLAVFMLLTACGNKHKEETPAQNNTSNNSSEATLYIGTEGNFKEYTVEIDSLSPENLLKAMSELTDWNLDLAADITTGKGGMSVCLSNNSALFMGPPDPQKDEFHIDRALAFQAGGRGFEPRFPLFLCCISSVVEHFLGKEEVLSSTLSYSSIVRQFSKDGRGTDYSFI